MIYWCHVCKWTSFTRDVCINCGNEMGIVSLDKGIEHGKEHRKQYYSKSKLYFASCRNHGDCPYCEACRRYKKKKKEPYDGE